MFQGSIRSGHVRGVSKTDVQPPCFSAFNRGFETTGEVPMPWWDGYLPVPHYKTVTRIIIRR